MYPPTVQAAASRGALAFFYSGMFESTARSSPLRASIKTNPLPQYYNQGIAHSAGCSQMQ
ncbi:MAG: hypothetical protein EOP10_13600 [Proteobacteria bacterium]|nr:MAG: hypothetical protein EOP10_13600 [Pseudomonadota bacterium]